MLSMSLDIILTARVKINFSLAAASNSARGRETMLMHKSAGGD
jgi:hypothetical protein